MMFDIDIYENELNRICKKHSVQKLFLVGSATRGDLTDVSDIDVMVNFLETKNTIHRYFDLKENLKDLFQ